MLEVRLWTTLSYKVVTLVLEYKRKDSRYCKSNVDTNNLCVDNNSGW
jgi:hypothetical protein